MQCSGSVQTQNPPRSGPLYSIRPWAAVFGGFALFYPMVILDSYRKSPFLNANHHKSSIHGYTWAMASIAMSNNQRVGENRLPPRISLSKTRLRTATQIICIVIHGSLNVPMGHITQPWMVYGLLDGYFFRWCPIYPKWDSYQPQLYNLLAGGCFFCCQPMGGWRTHETWGICQYGEPKKLGVWPIWWRVGFYWLIWNTSWLPWTLQLAVVPCVLGSPWFMGR